MKVHVTALDGGFAGGSQTLTVTTPPKTTAPSISGFAVTNKVFTVGSKATAVAALRHPRGTVLRYTLSEPAAVTVTIAREAGGRKVHGKCVKPSRKNAKSRRCTRYLKVGAIRRAGTRGANKLPFSGRIGKTALAPATYRATIVAVAAGGLRSNSRTVSFRIVSR